MATANDSVYVKFIADTSDFMNKVKGAIQPLQQFMRVMNSLMTLGGAAIVLKQIAAQIGEMEKAYAKLYPESQKAAGSLAQWNAFIEETKAKSGKVVSDVLNPIRDVFMEIIDPIGRASAAINALNKELRGISEKYTSSATKKFRDIAEANRALAKATNDNKEAQSNLNAVLQDQNRLLAKRPTMKNIPDIEGMSALENQIRKETIIDEWQLAYDKLTAKANAYKNTISETAYQMAEIPKWIKEQTPEAKKAAKEIENLALAYDGLYESLWKMFSWSASKSGKNLKKTEMLGAQSEAFGNAPWANEDFEAMQAAIDNYDNSLDDIKKKQKEISDQWQNIADLVQSIGAALGEAFVTGDYLNAIQQIISAIMDLIAKEAIAAGLKMILAGNVPMGLALMALGGVAMGIGGAVGSSGRSGGSGVEIPRMATGGIVTRPTLAMIGEAGPEAVVPLGRGGTGDVNIIVQGSVWQTEDLARAVAGAMGRW